jgi:hypothetical protein
MAPLGVVMMPESEYKKMREMKSSKGMERDLGAPVVKCSLLGDNESDPRELSGKKTARMIECVLESVTKIVSKTCTRSKTSKLGIVTGHSSVTANQRWLNIGSCRLDKNLTETFTEYRPQWFGIPLNHRRPICC